MRSVHGNDDAVVVVVVGDAIEYRSRVRPRLAAIHCVSAVKGEHITLSVQSDLRHWNAQFHLDLIACVCVWLWLLRLFVYSTPPRQAPLTLADDGKSLYCEELDVHYAIVDGVPHLKTVGFDMSNSDSDEGV